MSLHRNSICSMDRDSFRCHPVWNELITGTFYLFNVSFDTFASLKRTSAKTNSNRETSHRSSLITKQTLERCDSFCYARMDPELHDVLSIATMGDIRQLPWWCISMSLFQLADLYLLFSFFDSE